MLKSLSDEGVIVRTGREFGVRDCSRLREAGGFDPTYLHEAA